MTGAASAGYDPGFSAPRQPLGGRRRRRLPRAAARGADLPPALIAGPRRRATAGRRGLRSQSAAAPSAEQRLVRRITMGWTLAEQARIGELGYDGYLEEQLAWRTLDDGPLEGALAAAFPTLAMSPAQIYQSYLREPAVPIFQLIVAAFYRSLYSPRQLFERMATFWSDHFSVDLFSGLGFLLKPTDDREVIRRHALGRFPDLLRASARSPAMLSYLTNDSNRKDHPNENYARELLELHTLGADNGYTQRDVREVARCFTGWRIQGRAAGAELGRFVFDPTVHDTGSKRVLGRTIPAGGGIEDGEQVLEILAGDRRTARFIAEKLLVWVWGYEPRGNLITRVANAYSRSGGDIPEMLRTALAESRLARARPKLKRPFHLEVSALRALFAEVPNPRHPLEHLDAAGHLPFAWPAPNGYPDSAGYWAGFVLSRWNFAASLMQQKRSRVRVDLSFVDPGMAPAKLADRIAERLLGGVVSAATRGALEEFLGAAPVTTKRIREAIGLALASPEFQEY